MCGITGIIALNKNGESHISKIETTVKFVEGIVIKLIERWNKSDEISQRHREDIVKELNDVTDDLSFLKGRINGRTGA